MESFHLELVCETEVAISKRSATLGGHESLPYLPGRLLLGACAKALYAKLEQESPELSFRVFHSGEVRFGDGLPGGWFNEPAYPMPRALHRLKAKQATGEDDAPVRLTPFARNFGAAKPARKVQYKQLRDGFVDRFGCVTKTQLQTSLRTAVDPSTGQARDGLLYALSVVAEGTRFLARIDADDPALLARVRDAFEARPVVFLGRSRTAELGRVRVTVCGAWSPLPSQGAAAPVDRAVFWCLSDLALQDPETGQPTFTPSPTSFGLPAAFERDREHTFLRTRRYAPFHGKRQRPDMERQVIEAGSVLVFLSRTGAQCDPAAVRQAVEGGVGLYRQDGLGQVAFAPRCLANEKPVFEASPTTPRETAPASQGASAPGGELSAWLEQSAKEEERFDEAWKQGNLLAKEVLAVFTWRRLPASQWGEIARIARRSRSGNLLGHLQSFVDEGVRATTKAWGAKGPDNATLAGWIQRKARELLEDPNLKPKLGVAGAAMAMELLAKRAVRQERASRVKGTQAQEAAR